MSEQPKRRGRGKGKRPAMTHVNLRLPTEVAEYFKWREGYTRGMRNVLIAHVNQARPDDSDPPPPYPHQLTLPLP